MVPLKVKFTPGQSIFDQVCFAATRSMLAGTPRTDARTQRAIERFIRNLSREA
jgi:hypothetical protein